MIYFIIVIWDNQSYPTPKGMNMNARTTSSSSDVITYHDLITSFHQFLIILTHSILYHRRVYPDDSFKLVRFYDIAVQQNRHPGVCDWIQAMAKSCIESIEKGNIFIHFTSGTQVPNRCCSMKFRTSQSSSWTLRTSL